MDTKKGGLTDEVLTGRVNMNVVTGESVGNSGPGTSVAGVITVLPGKNKDTKYEGR